MFTTIFTIAVGWLATNITGQFTLDSDKAKRSAKYLFYFLSAIALLIVLFLSGLLIKNCYTNWQIDKTRSEVQKGKAESDLIETNINSRIEKQKELEKEGKKLNENSTKSNTEFNNAERRDSDRQSGNFSTSEKRFCDRFPTDSSCEKLRR